MYVCVLIFRCAKNIFSFDVVCLTILIKVYLANIKYIFLKLAFRLLAVLVGYKSLGIYVGDTTMVCSEIASCSAALLYLTLGHLGHDPFGIMKKLVVIKT